MVLFTVKTPHPIRILAHRAHHMRSTATWAVQVVGSPSRTVCKPSTDLNGEICSVLHGGQLVHLQATAHITTLTQNSQISHRPQNIVQSFCFTQFQLANPIKVWFTLSLLFPSSPHEKTTGGPLQVFGAFGHMKFSIQGCVARKT